MNKEELISLLKKQKELLEIKISKEEEILKFIRKKLNKDKKHLEFTNKCIGYIENFSFEVAKKRIRELVMKYPEMFPNLIKKLEKGDSIAKNK